MPRDGRVQPRMSPPQERGKRGVVAQLDPADYRALYELTLASGLSMAETLRELIRAAFRNEGGTA